MVDVVVQVGERRGELDVGALCRHWGTRRGRRDFLDLLVVELHARWRPVGDEVKVDRGEAFPCGRKPHAEHLGYGWKRDCVCLCCQGQGVLHRPRRRKEEGNGGKRDQLAVKRT